VRNISLTELEFLELSYLAIPQNLNPFLRDIHVKKYTTSKGKVVFNLVVGYEVYIKRAEESGNLDGWHVWTEEKNGVLYAKIKIWRKDKKHPFEHEVSIKEYQQFDHYGNLNPFWKDKPETMLKKVCESQAFRRFFSTENHGLPYAEEEMFLDNDLIETKKLESKTTEKKIESPLDDFKKRLIDIPSKRSEWILTWIESEEFNKLKEDDVVFAINHLEVINSQLILWSAGTSKPEIKKSIEETSIKVSEKINSCLLQLKEN
jgi:phage recombination protein Bet